MEFKIDTKPVYTLFTPVATSLNANLADALYKKWTELLNNDNKNVIVALDGCTEVADDAAEALLKLHTHFYESGASLVLTGLQPALLQNLKNHESYDILNLAPTMAEAIDIVNMEILERDLFNEE
jgi:anti-anti-sigma regulatory factor